MEERQATRGGKECGLNLVVHPGRFGATKVDLVPAPLMEIVGGQFEEGVTEADGDGHVNAPGQNKRYGESDENGDNAPSNRFEQSALMTFHAVSSPSGDTAIPQAIDIEGVTPLSSLADTPADGFENDYQDDYCCTQYFRNAHS